MLRREAYLAEVVRARFAIHLRWLVCVIEAVSLCASDPLGENNRTLAFNTVPVIQSFLSSFFVPTLRRGV